MSKLAFASEPLLSEQAEVDELFVAVTVDALGTITASPATLTVHAGFDGKITWTLEGPAGTTFTNPAVTFAGGQTPPSFELANASTGTSYVRRWGNFLRSGAEAYSYYYTLHVKMPDGTFRRHDPTVENIPPTP